MNRREAVTTIGLGSVGFIAGSGFSAPACSGPSKEKAVKITGLVIELSKESVPLLQILGANDIADLVSTKAVPALEKLKEALSKADLPTAGSALQTTRSILGGISQALLNLPDSPRRTIILGILTSVNMMLLTVESFIESETPEAAAGPRRATGAPARRLSTADAIEKAYQATKP